MNKMRSFDSKQEVRGSGFDVFFCCGFGFALFMELGAFGVHVVEHGEVDM